MLQAAGDFGFQHEARPALRMIGVAVLDFLECDLAVQLVIESDKDFAEPALRMEAENLKASAGGSAG